MSTRGVKRILRDLKQLYRDPLEGIIARPFNDDCFTWTAIIFGPYGTPWMDGVFILNLEFSGNYPNEHPKVSFESKMFHPNVYADGSVWNFLENQWRPSYDVATVLTSLQSLICYPNLNGPANHEAARLFTENRPAYYLKVLDVVLQSWEWNDRMKARLRVLMGPT